MTVGDITSMNGRIGRLRIEPTQVRGEGGLVSPALVLPLTVELEAQPAEQRLAVTEVRAELSLGAGSAHAGSRLGEPVRVRGRGGDHGVWATIPGSTTSDAADLRFALTALQVHLLDTAATPIDRLVNLLVRFEVEAAWVRDEPQNALGQSSGSAVELLPPASVRASEITLPGRARSGLRGSCPRSGWTRCAWLESVSRGEAARSETTLWPGLTRPGTSSTRAMTAARSSAHVMCGTRSRST
jgi:hypothetical protein